jgi:hypothetical protein
MTGTKPTSRLTGVQPTSRPGTSTPARAHRNYSPLQDRPHRPSHCNALNMVCLQAYLCILQRHSTRLRLQQRNHGYGQADSSSCQGSATHLCSISFTHHYRRWHSEDLNSLHLLLDGIQSSPTTNSPTVSWNAPSEHSKRLFAPVSSTWRRMQQLMPYRGSPPSGDAAHRHLRVTVHTRSSTASHHLPH